MNKHGQQENPGKHSRRTTHAMEGLIRSAHYHYPGAQLARPVTGQRADPGELRARMVQRLVGKTYPGQWKAAWLSWRPTLATVPRHTLIPDSVWIDKDGEGPTLVRAAHHARSAASRTTCHCALSSRRPHARAVRGAAAIQSHGHSLRHRACHSFEEHDRLHPRLYVDRLS